MDRNEDTRRVIGKYALGEEIGRGGMAVVYRAVDTVLEREVALKLLHPHLASHLESRKRFQREARAVARLRHPAATEIYDYSGDDEEEDVYIVMELVEGTNLRRFLQEQATAELPAELGALILLQIANALAQAHDNGVIHRDIKPENVLIGQGGAIKLTDFGIAQLAGVTQMTTTGQILGSPAYMSPEHIERPELDARADIFSLGTVLYEMVTGRTPFEGKNPHAVIKRIIEADYDDPLQFRPAVGHHLATIIRRCLRRDPEDRYGSTRELIADLSAAVEAMGLGEPEAELAAFFEDPDRWAADHKPRVVERTLALGITARKAKRLPEAMDHFNRVLALEPGNEAALSAVAGLSRRRFVRRSLERVAVIAAIVVVLGGVGFGIARALTSESQPEPAVPDAAPSSPDAGKAAPAAVTEPGADAAVADAGKDEAAKPRPVRLRPRQRREVVFTPYPPAVSISIDGKKPFVFDTKNQSRSLYTGSHSITFIPNDEKRLVRETWKVSIPPGNSPFKFGKRLRFRPAKLLVESNVESVVTVPGRGTGRTNEAFDVGIREGPEEEVSVLVTAEGYRPRTRRVRISAGEAVRTTINLERDKAEPASP